MRHLAQLTGAPYEYLRDVSARRRDPYLDIVRTKRDGETRPISSPEPVLMDVQRWILDRALVGCTFHPSSYAYQRGRSIVDCANVHIGARWLVKLDIHDFFDSVSERRVFDIFQRLGYPRLLCLELARVCTRVSPADQIARIHRRYHEHPPYEVNAVGRLPQGAPTSGALANAVMAEVDEHLATLARKTGGLYSRYSDDLTFFDFRRELFAKRRGRLDRTRVHNPGPSRISGSPEEDARGPSRRPTHSAWSTRRQ